MKRCLSLILVLIFSLSFFPFSSSFANEEMTYKIYSDSGEILLEKQDVHVGDSFLTSEFKKYEIVQVDEENAIGFAKFVQYVSKPKIDVSFSPSQISQVSPTICLYMTHNDESYITGDGVDSVYGTGGIHDVAKRLKSCFEQEGITVHIDETLHIPHDAKAYSRSSATAKKLINEYNPDAIFDIHRDGASRSTYVKNIDNKDRCKVRIVVGKASDNYEIAEQFALYLLSVASEVCDWLFLDIYYASGHYNQGLHNKALLFEMGSHKVEKSLVLETVPELAKVIDTALFNTTVDEEGDLTINGASTPEHPTISEKLDEIASTPDTKKASTTAYLLVLGFGFVVIAVVGIIFKINKKGKSKSKK